MKLCRFRPNSPLLPYDVPPQDHDVVWLDVVRGHDDLDWPAEIERLTGIQIEPQHVIDGNNARHQSFFDGTPRYDLLIFQGLGPDNREKLVETRTAAFFMFNHVLVTVRASDNVSFEIAHERLVERDGRLPASPLGVAHFVLDIMVDRYLAIREPLTNQMEELQDALVDPDNPYADWKELLNYRRGARKLEGLSSGQQDALDSWRRNTRFSLSDNQTVRLNDLNEHISRVYNAAKAQQADIESAVQLHFSAVAHSTNKTVTALTVLSAIFLPLGLLAGIYGMNFEYIPELKYRYGYFIFIGTIITIAVSLLLFFRRRKLI